MSNLNNTLLGNRTKGVRSIITYLNFGDPVPDMSNRLVRQCARKGVDVIELGVPFPNSYTDGNTILKSHQRALGNHITIDDVFEYVQEFRKEHSTPIVLLADFAHSVKPVGIQQVVKQCSLTGIDGLLLHGLPPLYLEQYVRLAEKYGIDPILSLYPNSSADIISRTVKRGRGFLYLVSQYGKSGKSVDFFSESILSFYATVRRATTLPLMAGFGIKSRKDIQNVYSSGLIDGVIIGSAISTIIESGRPDPERIINQLDDYLDTIIETKSMDFNPMKK